ncbi:MAG TPA: hypothetical protein ENI15_06595 [Spirochaetes bacterium]|nr:hypothetical protein [Spirochaetota bacterium]
MLEEIKVGLLTGGYFEYWRMYDGLEKEVEKDMKRLYEGLNKEINVVWSGLADTLEKTEEAGKMFRKENIDLLVICEGTYFPDYFPIKTLDYIQGVPVLILLTQPKNHVPADLDYRDATHHSFGVVGVVQLTGAFRKMGRKFELMISSLDDPSIYKQVAEYVRIVAVAKKIRFLNLGIVGHTFQGMYDLEMDKTKLKSEIGPNVTYLEVSELVSIWNEIEGKKAAELAEKARSMYKVEGPDSNDMKNACRLGLAMEKLAQKYKLDGLSHLCQHLIHVQTGTTPCYGVGHLTERGIMATCEGDLGNLVSMCILHFLTDDIPCFFEWGMYDVKEDAMLLVHHGGSSPLLARDPGEVTITPTGEKWGFKGKGASYRYMGKPGYLTIMSLIDDKDGWKMLISGGEALDSKVRPFYGHQFMVRMKSPVKDYLYALCSEGVTHHGALVYGDVRDRLEKVASLLNIRTFFLE